MIKISCMDYEASVEVKVLSKKCVVEINDKYTRVFINNKLTINYFRNYSDTEIIFYRNAFQPFNKKHIEWFFKKYKNDIDYFFPKSIKEKWKKEYNKRNTYQLILNETKEN